MRRTIPTTPTTRVSSFRCAPATLAAFEPADAAAALGGRRGDPNAGIPSRDGAIVAHASRFGVTPNVRAELAAKDAAFRKSKLRFTKIKILREDIYNEAYKRQTLDPNEIARLYRNSGIATPTAPPSN